MKITKTQLQEIIKEGVLKLHRKTILENEKKELMEELKMMGEVFYKDSDGDFDFDKSEMTAAENLYDKGQELFNNGDLEGAENFRQQALKKGSWLGWGETELPPYSNYTKDFDNMMGNPLDNMDFLGENSEVASPIVMSILINYLEAALWTEEDEIGNDTNIEADVSNDSKIDAYTDVKKFMSQAGDLIDDLDPEQVGHDLWLTRNGHGTGFWDRDLGEVGEKLSNIASNMGEKHLFWGEDGKIHIE